MEKEEEGLIRMRLTWKHPWQNISTMTSHSVLTSNLNQDNGAVLKHLEKG